MTETPSTLNARIAIEGTYNFRDIGGYPTADLRTRRGVLYRSDAFHRLTRPGSDAMKRLGIRRLVDLRSEDEVDRSPNAVDGVETLKVPIFSGSAESFIGPDLTLGELYEFVLEESAEAVVLAVQAIADSSGPVVVHCTAGKDRTGIVIAVVLRLLGVAPETIAVDYSLTATNLAGPWTEAMLTSIRATGYELKETQRQLVSESPAPVMLATLQTLDERWGSAEGYLLQHGLPSSMVAALRTKLLEGATGPEEC